MNRPRPYEHPLQQQERYDASLLLGAMVAARDGDVGKVHDIYFDDSAWTVRYLVVDTGGWLTGRKVLVSPHAVSRIVPGEGMHVNLGREQIQQSPDYDNDKPVSRQYETMYYTHYGYPYYWVGPNAWGVSLYPGPAEAPLATDAMAREAQAQLARDREHADPHLRSAKEVRGYGVEAADGRLGNVDSFLIDARSWEIVGFIVDTRNWLPGKHVAISTARIGAIDWGENTVAVRLAREAIKSLPEYDSP